MNDQLQLMANADADDVGKLFIIFGIMFLAYLIGFVLFSALLEDSSTGAVAGFAVGLVAGLVIIHMGAFGIGNGDAGNVQKFEKAYGVQASAFIPKDSKERELSETLKHSTEGSNEYIYNYKGGSQTVTVNIDSKGMLRMFSDEGPITRSDHERTGRLQPEGEAKAGRDHDGNGKASQ